MINKLSDFAEVYDLEKMNLFGLEKATFPNRDNDGILLHTIHLWINKANVLEFYLKPDLQKIDFKNKKFILIRFVGSYCDEHQTFHTAALSDDRIRYYAHYVLCRLGRFLPMQILNEKRFRLTMKMVNDIQFIESRENLFNPFDLSSEDFSQTMSETTFQSQTQQLIAETELICQQVKQFKDKIDKRLIHTTFLKWIDHY